jgi:hypothetical protein
MLKWSGFRSCGLLPVAEHKLPRSARCPIACGSGAASDLADCCQLPSISVQGARGALLHADCGFVDGFYQPPSPTRCRCMEVAGAYTCIERTLELSDGISYIMQQWCLVHCGTMVRDAAQLYVMTDAGRIALKTSTISRLPPRDVVVWKLQVCTLASSGRWSSPKAYLILCRGGA